MAMDVSPRGCVCKSPVHHACLDDESMHACVCGMISCYDRGVFFVKRAHVFSRVAVSPEKDVADFFFRAPARLPWANFAPGRHASSTVAVAVLFA